MAYPEHYLRSHLDAERGIVDRLISTALSKGWSISVYDGEEYAIVRSTDYDLITSEIAATDETMLLLRDARTREKIGAVWLVHGNGRDVISDCSDNLAMTQLIEEVA